MLKGHGDDMYKYPNGIIVNFSSNVYNHFNQKPLLQYLANRLDNITSYPEPTPTTTESHLATWLNLKPEEVCVTNGATEAIYLIAQALRESRTAILQPTFSEYADACHMHAHKTVSIYRLENIPTDADDVWICNPNNPTGAAFDETLANELWQRAPLFIMDHSYTPFTLQKLLTPRESADKGNILTLHSMTKEFAIPGIRLGYVTGHADLIEHVRNQRMPWSVNQIAILAADYLLTHADDYLIPLTTLLEERKRVADEFKKTGCIEVWPSDSHMLLCRLRIGRAAALKDYLATEHGLLIRDASNFTGLSDNFFRIAVQTAHENNLLINAIKKWFEI